MKTVILGAAGMLGNALMHAFRASEPLGLDKDQLDITDKDAVFAKLAEIQPELVINAAAYTSVDDAENNEAVAMRVNGYSIGYLAEFCAKKNALLVHFSTDYVFDGATHSGYHERSLTHPLNIYGQSKVFGEELLCESGASYYLIRSSWLFGPDGSNFVKKMLEIGREKKEVRVVHDQIGKPTYTVDLAEAVRSLTAEKRPFGIYHLVNEDPVSWFQFAQEICAAANLSLQVIPQSTEESSRPAKRPACSILTNTRFPLLRSHKEALREYVRTLDL